MKSNKVKKIIIFYPSYENGGATKILQNLVTFFTFKKINIILISCNANYNKFRYNKNYFKILKPKVFSFPSFFQRINLSLSALKVFTQQINKIDDDKTVIFSMQSHLLPVLLSKIFNKKIIIRNSEDPFGATKYADEKFFSLIVFLTKFISFNLASGIITNSSISKKSIGFFLFNKKKVQLIFNPYLNKKSQIKTTKRDKDVILAIGRFTKQKNFIFLIKVFNLFQKKYKNYKLIIIGSGKDKYQLLNVISKLNLNKKITLLKWQKDLKFYFKNSKFFILPSLYEGLPNILIDAVYNGIPCISSNCSGSRDILMNGKIGSIYKKNEEKYLLNSMIKMHKNYNKYQKNSVKFTGTCKRFFVEPQSKKYLNYFNNFI